MFDCIGIASKNIEASISFYNIFGLDFIKYGDDHYEAQTQSGVRIMLDSHELLKKLNPNFLEVKSPTTSFGFKKDKPTMVDELFTSLKDSGAIVIKEPWDAFWGQRYASVLDPDGNQIDIFSPLEE